MTPTRAAPGPAALTAIMTGNAYATSARIAARMGPFEGYEKNAEPMLGVIEKHRAAAQGIADPRQEARNSPTEMPPGFESRLSSFEPLVAASRATWAEALELGREYGYRNSQATVLAPTGTISFMMDCDTTGIEPDIALVKYKTLVGAA